MKYSIFYRDTPKKLLTRQRFPFNILMIAQSKQNPQILFISLNLIDHFKILKRKSVIKLAKLSYL